MNRKLILGFAGAVLIAPSAAYPQAAATTVEGAQLVAAQGGGGRGGRVMAGAVETKVTTGRPYSAEAVTEMTQVLGDGNRINRQSVVRVYRDGEGRTRREMFGDDGSARTISISDPVAHVNYTLNPQEKIAYKAGVNIVAARMPGGGTYTVTSQSGSQGTATVSPTERPATVTLSGGRGRGAVTMRSPAKEDPNVKKEDLGVQNVEGVMATGSRTTTTIPAGQIGNVLEIRIVSEQWFSDELQVLVMTRHSDPRSGETVYKLRNILRAEPDQSLFTVPPDYTVQERGIRQRQ